MATLHYILLKAKGKKDTSKLQKKQIIDRKGKRTAVWVRVGEKAKEYGFYSKICDMLNGFFGKGKFRSKHDIDEHVKSLKDQGAPKELDTDHFIEYFTNKATWDAKFSGVSTKIAAAAKQSAGEKDNKTSDKNVDKNRGKSVKGEKGESKGGTGAKWNMKVMEYLIGKYGENKAPKAGEFSKDGALLDDKGKVFNVSNGSTADMIVKKYKQTGIDLEPVRGRTGDYTFVKKGGGKDATTEKPAAEEKSTGGMDPGHRRKLIDDFAESLMRDVKNDPHYIDAAPDRQQDFLNACRDNAKTYVDKVIKQIGAKDKAWLTENLHTGNKNTRKMFKSITGIDLGGNQATTKAGIDKWVSGEGEGITPAEKEAMTSALKTLKPISDEFQKIVAGKRSYNLEEVYGDDRAIKIGGRGYSKKDFTAAQVDRLQDMKAEIDKALKPIKHDSYDIIKNEIHLTRPKGIKGEDKEATRSISDKIGAGTKPKAKKGAAENMEQYRHQRLKEIEDEIKQRKDEAKTKHVDPDIIDSLEEQHKWLNGSRGDEKLKNEYHQVAATKKTPSIDDMHKYPDIAAEYIKKESGINFYDNEDGKIRAKYNDQQIEVDSMNTHSFGYTLRINGNIIKGQGFEDKIFRSPVEIKKYLDDKKSQSDKATSDKEQSLKSQGWEPIKKPTEGIKIVKGKPGDTEQVDPKNIRDAFKVWGETILIVKRGVGFQAIEQKTGLTLTSPFTSKAGAIDSAKDILHKQGKNTLVAAIARAKHINNNMAKALEQKFNEKIFLNGFWL